MAWVTAPDGTPGSVPDEQLQAALKAGYVQRQPTEAEKARAAAGEQTLRAGVEGVVRGATFGFGEPFLVNYAREEGKTEAQARKEIKLRQEENPIASTVGEMAGGVGVAALTGGGVAGLVGGGVRGAVVEGGLYGLGHMYSEAALDDTELTGQKAAASMAAGALGGAALHGAFNIVGKGVSAGLKKLGGMTSATSLEQMGKELKWSTLSQANKRLMRQNESLKSEIVDLADNLGVSAIDENSLLKVEAHVGPSSPLASEYQSLLQKMDQSPRIKLDDLERIKIGAELERLLAKAHPTPADKAAVQQYASQIQSFVDDSSASWQYMKDWQARLFGKVDPNESSVAKTLREGLKDTIEKYAEKVSPGLGASFRRIQKDYAVGYGLQEMLANRVASQEAKGPFNVGSLLARTGQGIGAAVGGLPGMVVGGIADDMLQKRGGFIAGSILQKLGRSPTLQGVGTALHKHVGKLLSMDPALLGAFRVPLEQAWAEGVDSLLSAHLQLSSNPNYLPTLGMTPETPGEVEAAGQRLAYVDALATQAQDYDAMLDSAASGLLGAKPGRKASFKVPSTKDFEQRVAQLRDITRNPEGFFEGIPPEFNGAAPSTSGAAAQALFLGAQFLADKAPKSPYEGMPPALAQPWQPSQADLEKWYRYVDAVEGGPQRLLELAAQGALAKEHLEATQAVYPRLYEDLKEKLMERLSTWEKPVPYATRVQLAQFYGPQVLGISPQAVQVIQSTFNQQPSGGMGRPDGRQQVSQEKNLATQGQKLEAR